MGGGLIGALRLSGWLSSGDPQAAAYHVIMQTANHIHTFRYPSCGAYLRGSNRTAKNHKQRCAKLDSISSAQSGKLDSLHAERVKMHLQYCIYIYVYSTP